MTTVAVTVVNSEVTVEVTEPTSQPAAASAVSFTPVGSIAATNVQAAIAELDADIGIINSAINAFVFDGDSISTADIVGVGNDWPTLLMGSPTFAGKGTKYNSATSSSFVSGMVSRYAGSVYPQRPAANSGRPAYLFVMCGTNNTGSMSAPAIIAELEAYWTTAKADGFTLIALTITPANLSLANETKRQLINAAIRRSTIWDYLVDAAAVLPNKYDTNLYSDGLHPTTQGNRIIAREAEAVFLTKRKSPMPDVTGTRQVSKLVVGGDAGVATYTFSVIDDTYAGASSSIGNYITSTSYADGNYGTSHTGFVVITTQKGAGGRQYLYGINSTISLTSPLNISEASAITGRVTTEPGSGIIYSAIALAATSPYCGGGPIPTATGLLIQSQKVTGVTEGFAVRAYGAADKSFIEGSLTIGSSTPGSEKFNVTGNLFVSGTMIAGASVRLKNYTVATLPAGPTRGDTASVTDALAPAYLAVVVGGGAVFAPVIYNGTQWVTH